MQESTPIVIKHGNNSRDLHQHHFDLASDTSQGTPPSTSYNNPESPGIQSPDVSSSSDDSVEKINAIDTNKEEIDYMYGLKVDYLEQKASKAKAALEAELEAQIDALKAQIDALKAKAKAQIDKVDHKFAYEMKKAKRKRDIRLNKITDDEPNEAKRRKLDDNTRK